MSERLIRGAVDRLRAAFDAAAVGDQNDHSAILDDAQWTHAETIVQYGYLASPKPTPARCAYCGSWTSELRCQGCGAPVEPANTVRAEASRPRRPLPPREFDTIWK